MDTGAIIRANKMGALLNGVQKKCWPIVVEGPGGKQAAKRDANTLGEISSAFLMHSQVL